MLHYDVVSKLIDKIFGGGKEITFLEIGVFTGIMERTILKRFPNVNIISIEPASNPFTEEELKRIKFINKTSDEAIKDLTRQKIDFLYVDGDHSYEQCRRDILNYMPLVKKNGIIAGHDFHPHWGVIKAIEEIFGEVNHGDDLTWWVVKNDCELEGQNDPFGQQANKEEECHSSAHTI